MKLPSSVDAPLLVGREMTGEVTQTLDVDGTDLLDEHVSRGAIDVDLGPEGRRFGSGRRGCHEHN
jgi:hypothetical protein